MSEVGVATYKPEIIPLEPDLGNTSEGNDSQTCIADKNKPFPAGDGFFLTVALMLCPTNTVQSGSGLPNDS